MGVQARIVLYAVDEARAEAACAAAFRRIAELDGIFSDYRPDSEAMRLCDRAGGPPVAVGRDLFRVLEYSVRFSARCEGAFDVTVGPIVRLWREARRTGVLPSPAALAEARARVGWDKVELDPAAHTVRLATPGMRLDFGGIAKGYADDCALETLRRHGIRSALIEFGGDIAVSDPPPGAKGWIVEIPAAPGAPGRRLTVRNCAISTSGDTEQYVEIGGKRYSHIVDPRTGMGLTDRIAVTIVGPNGLTTEGLSKAVSVLGDRRGSELVRQYPGVRAFIRHLGAPGPRPPSTSAPGDGR